MVVFNGLNEIKIDYSTVVLLGKFDGMHRGHRKLFERARQIKALENTKIAVFTMRFADKPQSILSTEQEKCVYFEAEGADYVVECDFDEIKDITASDFITDIVLGKLKAKVLVAGPDCSFGKNKGGNADVAKKLMTDAHKRMEIIEKAYAHDNTVISSSYIKECMKNMLFEKAVYMLSHAYMFTGEVVHGNHIGHTLDFPTVNIEVDKRKVIPSFGVYASYVTIDGARYAGVSNIGFKPTVGSDHPVLETYVLDFDRDVYGKSITVELFKFIRKEMKFIGLMELKKQMGLDAQMVRSIMDGSVQ